MLFPERREKCVVELCHLDGGGGYGNGPFVLSSQAPDIGRENTGADEADEAVNYYHGGSVQKLFKLRLCWGAGFKYSSYAFDGDSTRTGIFHHADDAHIHTFDQIMDEVFRPLDSCEESIDWRESATVYLFDQFAKEESLLGSVQGINSRL